MHNIVEHTLVSALHPCVAGADRKSIYYSQKRLVELMSDDPEALKSFTVSYKGVPFVVKPPLI
jgi:hypothetical protein